MRFYKHRVLTVEAAIQAKDEGYTGIEVDVRRSGRLLVVAHDAGDWSVRLEELMAVCSGLELHVILDLKENGLIDLVKDCVSGYAPLIMGIPGQEAEEWGELARKKKVVLGGRISEYECQRLPYAAMTVVDSFENTPMPFISYFKNNLFIGPDLRGVNDYLGSIPEYCRNWKGRDVPREEFCWGMITKGLGKWKPSSSM